MGNFFKSKVARVTLYSFLISIALCLIFGAYLVLADITTVKYAENSTVNCSSNIQFIINVTNNNDYNLTNITINDTIGESTGLYFQDSFPMYTDVSWGNSVYWTISNLEPDATYTIYANFTAYTANNFTNTVRVSNETDWLMNASGNITVFGVCGGGDMGGQNLTVNLTSPSEGYTFTSAPFFFAYNVTGNGPTNCSLWGNFTGEWLENQTNIIAFTGMNNFTITNLSDGTYLWNVKCLNGESTSFWADSNRTFSVSTTSSPLIVFPSAALHNPDNFYSPYESWVNVSVNATITGPGNVVLVKANFTKINTTACDGDGYLNLTLMPNGFWEGNCSVASFINVSQVTSILGNISFVGTTDGGENISSDDMLFILMHNLGVPPMNPGPKCQKFGNLTTNMSLVNDFANVSYIIQIEQNGSCIHGPGNPPGSSPWEGYEQIIIMNFSSLNMSKDGIGQRLLGLQNALQVNITPPHVWGPTKIYLDSSAFEELNTATTITINNLPFTGKPIITSDNASRNGSNVVFTNQTPWVLFNPENQPLVVPNGDLIFSVEGFSTYDAEDNVAPLITLISPAGNVISGSNVISVIINGTGMDPSYILISLNASLNYHYNGSKYNNSEDFNKNTAHCLNMSSDMETFNCTFSVNLAVGDYVLNVSAWDFGGDDAPGNYNNSALEFSADGLDTTSPEVYFIDAPMYPDDYVNISGRLMIFTAGVDEITGYVNDINLANWTLDLYRNDLFNRTLYSGYNSVNGTLYSWNTSEDCAGECENYTLLLNATDSEGNSNSTSMVSLTIDNIPPNVSFVESILTNNDWIVRQIVSDNYLDEANSFVLDENGSVIIYWAHLCNESQGDNCEASRSGIFNTTWGFNQHYSLNGSFVPLYYKLMLDSYFSGDSYSEVPGCLNLNGNGSYDCGGTMSDGKPYTYYLVYNFSGENNFSLAGISSEQWCTMGSGCNLSKEITNGTSKFKPQAKYFDGGGWISTNLTELTLYNIGESSNIYLINSPADSGNYTFVFEGQDYSGLGSTFGGISEYISQSEEILNASMQLTSDSLNWRNSQAFVGGILSIEGYANGTDFANWTIFLKNGTDVINSSICNGTNPVINDWFCDWNTSQYCSGECDQNYSIILNVSSNNGNNQFWDLPLIIDNIIPEINENLTTTKIIIQFGDPLSQKDFVFENENISDNYLETVQSYIFNQENKTVIGFGQSCSEVQGDTCMNSESGIYNKSWNGESYYLNSLAVSAYRKFGFYNISDSTIEVPGCFDADGDGSYDCGGQCANQSTCRTYKWWIVYNQSNQNNQLLGLTNEQLCSNGCNLSTDIISGTSKFIAQLYTFNFSSADWIVGNVTNIPLYSAGASQNENITYSYANGNYSFAFDAQDYAQNYRLLAWDFSIDNEVPSITVHSPINMTYNNSHILINFSATDSVGISSMWYSNGTGGDTYSSEDTLTLNDGSYNFVFYSNDTSNNINSTNIEFSVDTGVLTISIISPENTTYNNATILVNLSYSGNAENVWFFNGTANETYSGEVYKTFAEGSNTIYAYANDSSGSLSTAMQTFTVSSCVSNITNTTWSGWTNESCFEMQMNQSRFLTQYDSNSCGEIENQTFYEYQLVGPTLQNTTWTSWTNVSCLASNFMNQTRNLTQYDIYSCSANQTFFEYKANQTCDYCLPILQNTTKTAWQNQGSCLANDTQVQNRSWIEYDSNCGGEIANVTYWETNITACDFCTSNLTNITTSWTNISCLSGNTMNQTRNITQYDNNSCGEIENQTFVEYKATEFCVFDAIFPLASVIYPQNLSYNQIITSMNYTANDANLQACWFNNGTANNTIVCGENITINLSSSEGSNRWIVYANDTSGNQNSSSVTFFVDTAPPYFITIPDTTNINYTQGFGVNFVAADALVFSAYAINWTTLFTINQSGYLKNSTVLPVGTYNINVTINDTVNNLNSTIYQIIVNKKSDYVLGISGTTPITYGTITDVAGSNCPTELTCSLNLPNATYGAGTVTFNYSTAGNANYSANSITKDIVIDKATPTLIKLLNSVDNNLTVIYPQQVNASGSTNVGTLSIYRNDTLTPIIDGQNYSLAAGYYKFDFNVTGNENYTNLSRTLYATVNKATGSIFAYVNNSHSGMAVAVNTSILLNATLENGVGNISLYNNGSLINRGTSPIGNLTNWTNTGLYNVTAIYAGNENYTSSSDTIWVNVYGSETQIINNETITLDENTTNAVLPANSSLPIITIGTNSTNASASIDLINLLNSTGSATLGNNTLILERTGDETYGVEIPGNTTIGGCSGWDGKIYLPQINTSSSLFNAPSGTLNIVISVGSNTCSLNFSGPVKIIIGGMAGKKAAWSEGSSTSLIDISTQCDSLTNPTNINTNSPRECYKDSGSDLVIWTYHFTNFAAYTPATTPPG